MVVVRFVCVSVVMRLVNGDSPYEGGVEVYYEDQWGTVCDDSWNIKDANVICRQLGYPPASQAWRNAHFGQGSGPILLSNVACNGNESSIDQCAHSGWFNHSCSHQEDVGVTCGDVIAVSTSSPGECCVSSIHKCLRHFRQSDWTKIIKWGVLTDGKYMAYQIQSSA